MLELVPFAAARNPIDVTGQVLNDPTLLDRAIELATGHGDTIESLDINPFVVRPEGALALDTVPVTSSPPHDPPRTPAAPVRPESCRKSRLQPTIGYRQSRRGQAVFISSVIDGRTGQLCAGLGTQTLTKYLPDHPALRSRGAAKMPEKRMATITCMLGSGEVAAHHHEHREQVLPWI